MLTGEKMKKAAAVVRVLEKTWVTFAFSVISAGAAFALACLAAAFARREVAETAFWAAFWLAFVVLCAKKSTPGEKFIIEAGTAAFMEWVVAALVGVTVAAWVVCCYILPRLASLAAGWGLF